MTIFAPQSVYIASHGMCIDEKLSDIEIYISILNCFLVNLC